MESIPGLHKRLKIRALYTNDTLLQEAEYPVKKDDQQTECSDVQYLNRLSQLPSENKTQFVLCPLPPDFLLFSGTSIPIHLFKGAEARDFRVESNKSTGNTFLTQTIGEQVLIILIYLILFKGIIIAILNYVFSNAPGVL